MTESPQPLYYEVIDPDRHTRSQWVVEYSGYSERWSVRYGAENIHGRWTHFPSVPFDSKSEAIGFVERMMARHLGEPVEVV